MASGTGASSKPPHVRANTMKAGMSIMQLQELLTPSKTKSQQQTSGPTSNESAFKSSSPKLRKKALDPYNEPTDPKVQALEELVSVVGLLVVPSRMSWSDFTPNIGVRVDCRSEDTRIPCSILRVRGSLCNSNPQQTRLQASSLINIASSLSGDYRIKTLKAPAADKRRHSRGRMELYL